MSQSSASLPQSGDLTMPKSVLTTEASQEGVAVLISKSSIIVDDNIVAQVPTDATHGVEGKYKRTGPTDLYIVPLANALQSWRERDRQVRLATGKDPSSSEAIIIADSNTPYRLLTDVLFTLGQSEFAKFHLMVLQSSGGPAKGDAPSLAARAASKARGRIGPSMRRQLVGLRRWWNCVADP